MKKIILSVAVMALSVSAFANVPKRLSSITEVERNSRYATTFGYNDEGKLNKITDDYSTVAIDYSDIANGKLKLTYTANYNEVSTFDITVNELGLATSAIETDDEGDITKWEFYYSDGKLSKITNTSDGDTEYVDLSWQDGLITSYVETESYDPDIETVTFEYSGITNTGKLMLLDEIYGIDLDELQYIALAGYMGEVPRELPIKATMKYESPGERDEIETSTINWETDAEGYPVKLTASDEPSWSTEFVWEEDNADVSSIAADIDGASKFYSIDGRIVDSDASGIVIEKKADGSTVKHIIRK
ncbi:MAG: DUF4595 domain-containing protein [Bacteroides sp.]|nr:DUF4595 domain-containing protein [Bacteroides sp.]